jgi:single-stranded-DNA-specific exonuclease
MGHAEAALKLLTDAPPADCPAIAKHLGEQNQHRQGVEKSILELACRMAEDCGQTRDDRRIICMAHESWHPGVVGIVCARLVERFGRPAILMHKTKEVCKGSARSIEGYSIHDALAAGSRFLTTWGGHSAAAGLTMPTANLDAFVQAVTEHANASIAIDQLLPSLTIDCDATLHELDVPTVQRLHALSPFGRGNRTPTLRIRNAIVVEPPRQMGAQGKHLQMRVKQDGAQGRGQNWIRAVWWSAGQRANDLAPGMRLDLAIEPRLNEWNGRCSVEAQLCDVRVCENSA